MEGVIRNSIITCPHCGFAQREEMPVDACQLFYDCPQCGTRLRPKEGDLLRVLLVRLGPLPAEAGGYVPSQMSTRRAREVRPGGVRNGGADKFVELLEADLPNAPRLATQHVGPIALRIGIA